MMRVWEVAFILMGVGAVWVIDRGVGEAMFLGGSVYALPQWFSTFLILLRFADHDSGKILASTLAGFIGKYMFTAVSAAVIFTRYQGLAIGWFMATLFFLYVSNLVLSSILIQLPPRR